MYSNDCRTKTRRLGSGPTFLTSLLGAQEQLLLPLTFGSEVRNKVLTSFLRSLGTTIQFQWVVMVRFAQGGTDPESCGRCWVDRRVNELPQFTACLGGAAEIICLLCKTTPLLADEAGILRLRV